MSRFSLRPILHELLPRSKSLDARRADRAILQETTMAKVGRFVTDRNGAFCQITLDSRERILVGHEGRGFSDGRINIELLKFLRFAPVPIFTCNLETPEGRAALAHLTRNAKPGSVEATALGAFVAHVRSCKSVREVLTSCAALMPR